MEVDWAVELHGAVRDKTYVTVQLRSGVALKGQIQRIDDGIMVLEDIFSGLEPDGETRHKVALTAIEAVSEPRK